MMGAKLIGGISYLSVWFLRKPRKWIRVLVEIVRLNFIMSCFFIIVVVDVLIVGYCGSSNCGWSSKEFDANMRASNGRNS
jgi:hypothetical protein